MRAAWKRSHGHNLFDMLSVTPVKEIRYINPLKVLISVSGGSRMPKHEDTNTGKHIINTYSLILFFLIIISKKRASLNRPEFEGRECARF